MRNKTKFLCSALLGSFGFAWIHLESIGFDWSWSDSIEFAWTRWDFLRLLKDSSAILSAILEFVLDSLGFSWSRLDSVGVDRIQSLSLGFVEILRDYRRIHQPFYQDSSSLSWIRLDSIGFDWIRWDSLWLLEDSSAILSFFADSMKNLENKTKQNLWDSLGFARIRSDGLRFFEIVCHWQRLLWQSSESTDILKPLWHFTSFPAASHQTSSSQSPNPFQADPITRQDPTLATLATPAATFEHVEPTSICTSRSQSRNPVEANLRIQSKPTQSRVRTRHQRHQWPLFELVRPTHLQICELISQSPLKFKKKKTVRTRHWWHRRH